MKLLYGTNSKTDFLQLTDSYFKFQLKICYGDPACLIVIIIILTPWHTVLEELIMLSCREILNFLQLPKLHYFITAARDWPG
jgi:hypothetical protein